MSNGPYISDYGDVISSALSVTSSPSARAELRDNFRIEAGQIERIYTVDDAENTVEGKKASYTAYDVVVIKPSGATEIIPRCRAMGPVFAGGFNNFLEVLPTDPGPSAKKYSVSRTLKRGHFVLIGYISGLKDAPVILGSLPHNNPVAVAKRPKKGKGTHLEGEVQGLGFIIDNDGALNLTFNGPRADDGSLVNQNGPTNIQIDKLGTITIETNAKQKVVIDRVSGHIRVDNGPTYIDMDKDGDKIQIVAKKIEVGTGGLQPQVVGDDMVDWLSQLVDELTKLYVPTGVGPSGTPINTPAFKALASALKDKILSKKHKVEK